VGALVAGFRPIELRAEDTYRRTGGSVSCRTDRQDRRVWILRSGPRFSPIYVCQQSIGAYEAHGASVINAGRAGSRIGWLWATAPLRSRRV
jgi:hypothetical protein